MNRADQRADWLYRSVGYSPSSPPNLVRLARALLGDGGICLVGRPGERGARVTSISADRIYLQHGASDEENVFEIARGIARWDASRGGPVRAVAALALAIALPLDVMVRFRAAGRTAEQIAVEHHLPLAVVRDREASLAPRHTARQVLEAK